MLTCVRLALTRFMLVLICDGSSLIHVRLVLIRVGLVLIRVGLVLTCAGTRVFE